MAINISEFQPSGLDIIILPISFSHVNNHVDMDPSGIIHILLHENSVQNIDI